MSVEDKTSDLFKHVVDANKYLLMLARERDAEVQLAARGMGFFFGWITSAVGQHRAREIVDMMLRECVHKKPQPLRVIREPKEC